MRNHLWIGSLVLYSLLGTWSVADAASPNTLTDEEKQAGFELLFNGKDLEGWEQKGNWKVEDGAFGRADKGGGLTYKVKPVPDNFELRFDWKVGPGSNSGIYYRPGQYEYQILDNAKHGDGKNPRTSAASLYFCMAPSKDATKPVGDWNSGRIVCQGSVIQHWLNDEKVIDFDYTDPKYAWEVELLDIRGADLKKRGAHLHLQDHGDPVWYRSLRWRTLTPESRLDRTPVTPMAIPADKLKFEREYVEKGRQQRAEQKAKAGK
ncbi:MAG: DUF1080 domain-containing protein [Planctomycetes bacterium]|nr:DUF1080 domain-containing protein [Planctomycetota bacterium]